MATHTNTIARQFAQDLNIQEFREFLKRQKYLDNNECKRTGFAYPEDNPLVWIKFGEGSDIVPEARTHRYAFRMLQQVPEEQRRNIYIPEVYRCITYLERAYMVMEYVRGRTMADLKCDTAFRAAFTAAGGQPHLDMLDRAIKLLLSFPVPENAAPGPYGGGLIRHPMFPSSRAWMRYYSVEELENHFNQTLGPRASLVPKITLERELHLVPGDLHDSNFMFTEAGDLYIIDFGQTCFLPLSLMTYAMREPTKWIASMLGEKLKDFPLPEKNQISLEQVSCVFGPY
ncbi:hypothetical protein QBC46DRAFT_389656 [Diplogelasinospora grovesii]|uniref:Aminoglycoside phosphotransferase domain-containing protein n=1 Tax=Diplogelasinospora grovesii TaxID=303347 RepID=A0AAN6N447_9PEZI|nr:hypothetical protein QBC46DRAFT_389656 [Diplogelasinospora grovesii]